MQNLNKNKQPWNARISNVKKTGNLYNERTKNSTINKAGFESSSESKRRSVTQVSKWTDTSLTHFRLQRIFRGVARAFGHKSSITTQRFHVRSNKFWMFKLMCESCISRKSASNLWQHNQICNWTLGWWNNFNGVKGCGAGLRGASVTS